MANRPSNLPLVLSASSAGASILLLIGVLIWRANALPPVDPTGSPDQVPETSTSGTVDTSIRAIAAALDAADVLVRDGKPGRARAVLESAIGEHPDDQDLRLALAAAYVLQNEPGAAYAEYEAALAIGPRTPEIEFNAGNVAYQIGRLDRAEEHFGAAQAIDPSDARFPLYLAQVHIAQGNTDDAQRNLLLTTRLDETQAIAWGTLAQIRLDQNEPNVALGLVGRARQLEPAAAHWRVIEARAHNRAGDPESALAVLGGIPDAERMTLPILRLMGQTFGLLKRPEDAAQQFEVAAAARPNDAELLFETAAWCERAERVEDALAYAERAAALGSEPASQMVARLSTTDE